MAVLSNAVAVVLLISGLADGLQVEQKIFNATWRDGDVVVCDKELSYHTIRLTCGEQTEAIQVRKAIVEKWRDIDYSTCSHSTAEVYRLDTITEQVADECEGERGACAFNLGKHVFYDDMNYFSILFDCVPNGLIKPVCSSTKESIGNSIPLYLEINGFREIDPAPSFEVCMCNITVPSSQTLNLTTLYADIEVNSDLAGCPYDFWNIFIDDSAYGGSRCGKIEPAEEHLLVTDKLTMIFSFDAISENEKHKGGWFKLTGSTPFEFVCSKEPREPLIHASIIYDSTWIVESSSAIPVEITDIYSSTETPSSEPILTTAGLPSPLYSTTIINNPPKEDLFIPMLVTLVIISALFLLLVAWIIGRYISSRSRISEEGTETTSSTRNIYKNGHLQLTASESTDENNNVQVIHNSQILKIADTTSNVTINTICQDNIHLFNASKNVEGGGGHNKCTTSV